MEAVWQIAQSCPRKTSLQQSTPRGQRHSQVKISSLSQNAEAKKPQTKSMLQFRSRFPSSLCVVPLLSRCKILTARHTLLTLTAALCTCVPWQQPPRAGSLLSVEEVKGHCSKEKVIPMGTNACFCSAHIIELYIRLNQKIEKSLDVQRSMLSTRTQVQHSPHCQL